MNDTDKKTFDQARKNIHNYVCNLGCEYDIPEFNEQSIVNIDLNKIFNMRDIYNKVAPFLKKKAVRFFKKRYNQADNIVHQYNTYSFSFYYIWMKIKYKFLHFIGRIKLTTRGKMYKHIWDIHNKNLIKQWPLKKKIKHYLLWPKRVWYSLFYEFRSISIIKYVGKVYRNNDSSMYEDFAKLINLIFEKLTPKFFLIRPSLINLVDNRVLLIVYLSVNEYDTIPDNEISNSEAYLNKILGEHAFFDADNGSEFLPKKEYSKEELEYLSILDKLLAILSEAEKSGLLSQNTTKY